MTGFVHDKSTIFRYVVITSDRGLNERRVQETCGFSNRESMLWWDFTDKFTSGNNCTRTVECHAISEIQWLLKCSRGTWAVDIVRFKSIS